ncbi:hypothetical protein TRAPUB_10740 [Trametes pubescens]|uniref:Uncharacterized protein n=1 Tax=Trametes pubescens TaxID=154538 RepID=A0A1M2VYX6_TRAPU|nr:hypothetical protein TRAPUB_10740 [Trametes pubescens]
MPGEADMLKDDVAVQIKARTGSLIPSSHSAHNRYWYFKSGFRKSSTTIHVMDSFVNCPRNPNLPSKPPAAFAQRIPTRTPPLLGLA